MLTPEKIWYIATKSTKNLKNVVGFSLPYLTKENGRYIYKAPLLVQHDGRTIDMVGIAEITIDPYSGNILKTYTEEEIENVTKDLLFRRADG